MPTLDYSTAHTDQETDKDTHNARMRELLAHRRWVTAGEMVTAIGHRFAAALHVVRNGLDGGPPMDIEAHRMTGSHMYRYRWTGKYKAPQERKRCAHCGHVLRGG